MRSVKEVTEGCKREGEDRTKARVDQRIQEC